MHDRNQAPRRVDRPEPGYFELRLVRGGPLVGARIVHEDGLWSAWIDGELADEPAPQPSLAVFRIWHGGSSCDRSIYDFRLAVKSWAMANDPSHPSMQPNAVIDLGSRRSLF